MLKVDNKRAVDTHKALCGQCALHILESKEGDKFTAIGKVEADILASTLKVDDI
jgi:hypothetical protein